MTVTQRNDKEFITKLYENYHISLINYIANHSIDREDARDIAQETYFKLSRIQDTQVIESPQAFLYRTALNIIRDRSRSKSQRLVDRQVTMDEDLSIPSNNNPLKSLEASRSLQAFERAIKGLSQRTKTVFLLHRYQSMTYANIAEHCGISVSGVSKHMIKAIAHIDTAMEALK